MALMTKRLSDGLTQALERLHQKYKEDYDRKHMEAARKLIFPDDDIYGIKVNHRNSTRNPAVTGQPLDSSQYELKLNRRDPVVRQDKRSSKSKINIVTPLTLVDVQSKRKTQKSTGRSGSIKSNLKVAKTKEYGRSKATPAQLESKKDSTDIYPVLNRLSKGKSSYLTELCRHNLHKQNLDNKTRGAGTPVGDTRKTSPLSLDHGYIDGSKKHSIYSQSNRETATQTHLLASAESSYLQDQRVPPIRLEQIYAKSKGKYYVSPHVFYLGSEDTSSVVHNVGQDAQEYWKKGGLMPKVKSSSRIKTRKTAKTVHSVGSCNHIQL